MAPYRELLEEAIARGEVDKDDRSLLCLAMNRALHMSADAGRPSDAMRSTIWEYKHLGRDAFIASYSR